MTPAALLERLTARFVQDGHPPPDIAQTFVEAGGDSIAAAHFAEAIYDETGVDLSLALFFSGISLERLAQHISEQLQ